MSKLSDQELLEGNAHITTEEVRRDIADTEAEINKLKTDQAVSMGMGSRLQIGYAAAIRERRDFIDDLERLLSLRTAPAPQPNATDESKEK